MLVGDDVVDLSDPEAKAGATHPRFDARVFTAYEQAWLDSAPEPNVLRWTLWAAKESAWKLIRKLAARTVFSAPAFAVQPGEHGTLQVTHEDVCMHVHIARRGACLHAVAQRAASDVWPEDATLGPLALEPAASDGADSPSALVRRLAIRTLASHLDCEPSLLRIESDRRIPYLYRGERRLDVDLSLSHHGHFVAFASTLVDPRGQACLVHAAARIALAGGSGLTS